MSQRMKMNQHINTMASPPGEAGDITCAKACSRSCACKGLSINGQRIYTITDHTSTSCCRAEFGARERHESTGGVSHLAMYLAVE
jgi:hypothetical protein